MGRRFPAGGGIAGWVVASGEPMVVDDLSTDAAFDRALAESTEYVPDSLMAAPLISGDRVLGVLEVLDRVPAGPVQPAASWTCWHVRPAGGGRAAGDHPGAGGRQPPPGGRWRARSARTRCGCSVAWSRCCGVPAETLAVRVRARVRTRRPGCGQEPGEGAGHVPARSRWEGHAREARFLHSRGAGNAGGRGRPARRRARLPGRGAARPPRGARTPGALLPRTGRCGRGVQGGRGGDPDRRRVRPGGAPRATTRPSPPNWPTW